jgi:hypothetical protein
LEANFSCFAKIRWMPNWFAKLFAIVKIETVCQTVGVLPDWSFHEVEG